MIAILLTSFGILSRLIEHTPQFTSILAVAMFGGMYLSKRQALIVPVALMAVTDIILGFHDTMLYTYGSMLAVAVIGFGLRSRKSIVNVFAGSLLSSLIFFVVTNFGAFLTLYPRTIQGLLECYIMAIPFYKSTLLSTVAYSLLLYVSYEWMLKRSQGTALARLFLK